MCVRVRVAGFLLAFHSAVTGVDPTVLDISGLPIIGDMYKDMQTDSFVVPFSWERAQLEDEWKEVRTTAATRVRRARGAGVGGVRW